MFLYFHVCPDTAFSNNLILVSVFFFQCEIQTRARYVLSTSFESTIKTQNIFLFLRCCKFRTTYTSPYLVSIMRYLMYSLPSKFCLISFASFFCVLSEIQLSCRSNVQGSIYSMRDAQMQGCHRC